MVRVNKRQTQILNCLNKKFPNCLTYEVLLAELGNNPDDIVFLDDLKLKGLVDISQTSYVFPDGTRSHETPKDSWITLEGRAKLRESFFKKLMLFLMVIVSIELAIIFAVIKPF
jgi:hypothetical protein